MEWGGEVKVLAKRVRENVSKNKGLTNTLIRNFCFKTCTEDFKGLFSADRIPKKLCVYPRFIIVVNLGKREERANVSDLPVGHFVTIVGTPHAVYYLDPYGLPCMQENVLHFLRECRREVLENSRQIQDYDSVYCGMYSILFAKYADRDWPFKLEFCHKHLRRNDQKCVMYLKKMFSARGGGEVKIKPCKHYDQGCLLSC